MLTSYETVELEEREKIAQASASRLAVVEGSGKRSHWLDDPNRGLDRRDFPHGPKKGMSGGRRIGGGCGGPTKKVEESKFLWRNMRIAGRFCDCDDGKKPDPVMVVVALIACCASELFDESFEGRWTVSNKEEYADRSCFVADAGTFFNLGK